MPVEPTEQQRAAIDAEVAGWDAVAGWTGPCDRDAAEAALRRLYQVADLPEPDIVVWMDSPVGGAVAALALAGLGFGSWPELRARLDVEPYRRAHQVFDASRRPPPPVGRWAEKKRQRAERSRWPVRRRTVDSGHPLAVEVGNRTGRLGRLRRRYAEQLPDVLTSQEPSAFDDGVAGQLGDDLAVRVWEQLEAQVGADDPDRARVWEQLLYGPTDEVGELLRHRLRYQDEYLFTAHRDAVRLAATTLLHDFARSPCPAGTTALADADRAVGSWWPVGGALVLADRPVLRRLDDQERLHAEDGPALACADGWTRHAWHGVRVPADLVEGDGWDLERILTEPNTEIRRCAAERRGWDRLIVETGMRRIGTAHPDPGNPGRVLQLYQLPERLRHVYPRSTCILLVQNASTDRDGHRRSFGLPVPAGLPDALAAAAWTYGVTADEYAALDRAT